VSKLPWVTLVLSSLAVVAVFLDTTALFVAFPDITASFPKVAPQQLSWVLNGYTIVFAAVLVPMGKLADKRGHKAIFLAGSALFTVASPASLALVLGATPRPKIPVAVALWGAMGAVAAAIGPTLGAALVEAGGWRWVFVINLPIGIITIALGRRFLDESADPSAVLPSPLGIALVTLGSVLLSLGLVQSEVWGWGSARTVSSLLGGAVVLVLFVLHQSRTSAPVLDLSLFQSSNFGWPNAAALVFGTAFTAMFLSSILFLTSVWQWSILAAGLGVAPGPILVAITAPVLGRLAGSIGQRPMLLLGGVSFAIGGAWRLLVLTAAPGYVTDYLPSMLFTGLGVALCLPQLSSVIGQSLPLNRLGVGGAVDQAFRQFGGTLGVALAIGFIGRPGELSDALARFDRVWWILIIGGLATTLLSIPLDTKPAQPALIGAPA